MDAFEPQPIGSLTSRWHQPEWMDQPQLAAELHADALCGLGRVNWLSDVSGLFWPRLQRLARQVGRLRVLDLACGGGDVSLGLARRARRAGMDVQFVGCDLSSTALDVARRRAATAGVAMQSINRASQRTRLCVTRRRQIAQVSATRVVQSS